VTDFDPGTPPEGADDHTFAAWAASTAGKLLVQVRQEGLTGKELKDAGDLASHDLLMELLAKHRPDDAVLSEEGKDDKARLSASRVWIVDPVDGTRQFVNGDPGFCTLVALARGGVLHASWTYAPALDRFAVAVRGRGATVDGVPLRAGSPADGRDLDIATSHPDYTTPEQKRALLGLRTDGVAPRPCGSAGLEYLAVAEGRLDATAFSWEAAWDHAAGLLLVQEAGGAHLTLAGEPFRITGGNALPFTTARDAATARRVVGLLAGGA
jgi:fructose-1,6-bisphosphatase/inositol monophosphatase family enzyme